MRIQLVPQSQFSLTPWRQWRQLRELFPLLFLQTLRARRLLFKEIRSGESILGRYATLLPSVTVHSPFFLVYSYNALAPKGSIISQTYGGYSASEIEGATQEPNPPPTTVGAPPGEMLYVIPLYVSTLVFQPSWFEAASLVLIAFATILIALTAIGLFERGRAIRNNLFDRMTKLARMIWLPIARIFGVLSRAPGTRRTGSILNSKNLLVLFLACGIIMITLAALSGPDTDVQSLRYRFADRAIPDSITVAEHCSGQRADHNSERRLQ